MCVPSIVEDSLGCVRPILFEDGQSAECPYYTHPGGTGFLLSFERSVYFIMARHCLPEGRSIGDMRIFVASGKLCSFLPFDLRYTPEMVDGQDAACVDFLLLRVAVGSSLLPARLMCPCRSLCPLCHRRGVNPT